GRVDQVDLHTVPGKRDILRENGDAALPLEIVRVEDALPEVLVARDRAGLPEEAVDHGRLPVVDMRNDGDVSDSIEGGAVSWHQRCSRDLYSALKRKGTNRPEKRRGIISVASRRAMKTVRRVRAPRGGGDGRSR